MESCFVPADIMLPNRETDLTKWAVIACDQYTSQPKYWEQVEGTVGDAPSALQMILPEVYLEEKESRLKNIRTATQKYLEEGILTEQIHQGFVLTERRISRGIRIGIVGAVDLEQYDYLPDTKAPVRATEGTILSRIPPRVKIRANSPVESPHIMMLAADPGKKLTVSLYQNRKELRTLYDFELMLGGGHISGYAVEGMEAVRLASEVRNMQAEQEGVFLAVGDGNHSLAAAKAYWMNVRKELSEEARRTHPARYALAEVVSLYSPALIFEPIHRAVFGMEAEELLGEFQRYLNLRGMDIQAGEELAFLGKDSEKQIALSGLGERLPVDVLQTFLNECIKAQRIEKVDYIHGRENLRFLAETEQCFTGILTRTIEKEKLFPAIRAGGVLPRKTFSIGEAEEKRYYLECRKITSKAV